MDSLPPGAIPADQFEEAATATHETPADIQAAGLPANAIPADQFEEAGGNTLESKPINNSKAVVEGIGRTMTFGATDALQHGIRSVAEQYSNDPDFWADSDKDVSDRKDSVAGKTGEGLGVIGGFMGGAGAPGLIAKGAKALAPEATLWYAKLGSAALASVIEGGGIQAGDEISKSLLGQGDPEAPVSSALANIGYAGLISGGTGALFNGVGQVGMKGLSALENAKMGDRAHNVLTGMGMAAKAHAEGIPEEEVRAYVRTYKEYKPGVDLFYGGMRKAIGKVTKAAVDATFGAVGWAYGGPGGAYAAGQIANKFVAPAVEKILDKPLIGITNKAVIPVIMNSLSKGETSGLFNKLNYATNAAKGFKAIGKGIDAVLKAGTNQAVDFEASERDRKKIIDHLEEGGVDKEMQDSLLPDQEQPQGFAKGGRISKPLTFKHHVGDMSKISDISSDNGYLPPPVLDSKDEEADPADIIVAYHKDKPIGHISIGQTGKGAYARSVGVSPEHRRNGVAMALYDAAEKHLGKKLSPGDVNEASASLWEKRNSGSKDIEPDGGSIASLYPAHDMMLNSAKGRISNYLTSIKPSKNPSKRPFDRAPNLTEQDKTFNNAVGIAAAPLSILKGIKNGDIRAEDVKHFTSMYPELHQYMSKKFTEGIMNHQLDEEMLPYKTRLALSLFMGTALDTTMDQPSILAAQSVFAARQAMQKQPDKKAKGSPSKLGKEAKSYKTTDQAAESDRSSRD